MCVCVIAHFLRHFDQGNTDKALAKLRATLAWRKEFEVDRIVACTQNNGSSNDDPEFVKIMDQELSTGKIYARGYNRDGRVLLYMRGDREQTHHPVSNMRHLVWNLEKAIACTKRKSKQLGTSAVGLEKVILIHDFTNFSLASAPPMSVSKQTMTILQSHYPERFKTIYCFNAPFMFKVFWGMVKPFVNQATKDMIVFVNTDSAAGMAKFHQIFDDTSGLEEVTGGTAVDKLAPWDAQVYMNLPFDVAFDEKQE